MTDKMIRVLLVISLSINIFVLSSLAMYFTWLATGFIISDFWRGVTALFVWISTFGVGAVAFWKIVEKLSTSSPAREARLSL